MVSSRIKSITFEVLVPEGRFQRLLQLFAENRVTHVEGFVRGILPGVTADAVVVHAVVNLLKDEKIRAVFDVYREKFLMSMDIILPNPVAHLFRVLSKRFGYTLRVAKERYKGTAWIYASRGKS